MSFTYYEKHHLHDYVDKKGTYTKQEVDNQITASKTEITLLMNSSIQSSNTQMTSLAQTSIQTLKTQITELIQSNTPNNQEDPVDPGNEIRTLIQSSIQTALNKFKVELQKSMISLRNEQARNRIGRKSLTIPKTNYTWIKLLDASEIDGITTLQEIVILNVYIRRNDRYHHAKSDLVASSFEQLEFFFKADFTEYYCYFNDYPSDWSMECFLEYIKIPKEIDIEESEEEIEEGSDESLDIDSFIELYEE